MSVCNPVPPTSSEHCHSTAAGSVLTSLPALLIQCAKVKFYSPHFHQFRWISEDSPSLCQSLCYEMFTFVYVIVDFTETAEVLRAG